jgi:hypothetical protein
VNRRPGPRFRLPLLAGLLLAAFLAVGCSDTSSPAQPEAAPAETSSGLKSDAVESGRSLWGGRQDREVVLGLLPGARPDQDPWSFDLGFAEFSCQPSTEADGWRFSACHNDRDSSLDAFVPRDAVTGLKVHARFPNRGEIEATLSRILSRDEPVQSDNVSLLWQAPRVAGSGSNTGIGADGGVVFAPHFGGIIELLDATTGARLSVIDTARLRGAPENHVLEVVARKGYLYAATTHKGVMIFDVRDPHSPSLAGQHLVPGSSREAFSNIHTLQLSPAGPVLFAVNQSTALSDLRALDVSDPTHPRELGRFLIQRTPRGLDSSMTLISCSAMAGSSSSCTACNQDCTSSMPLTPAR